MALAKRQQAEGRPAAVLLADLDHFKSINDRFGHAVGDRVLQIFAEAANAKLGPYDLIGRLGGEEFAIVIYDCGRDKGHTIAERIRLAFESAAAAVDGRSTGGTVSLGLAMAQKTYASHVQLLSDHRWQALAEAGARPQRVLWASTSTKNPDLPDTYYLGRLAAPNTIDTVPEKTLVAFADHGNLDERLEPDYAAAERTVAAIADAGIDVDILAERLQRQGAGAFRADWAALLIAIQEKAGKPNS